MVRSRSAEDGGGKPPPPNPAMPYREDCWSEGATSTLIDAWGERYLELNRGNLRQKHWQEVADAVNSRRTAVKRPSRTDVQCKNRIDTIKKKYKTEKARIAESGGVCRSRWSFFGRLENLIGGSSSNSNPVSEKKPKALAVGSSSTPPFAAPAPSKKRPGSLIGGSLKWGSYSASAAAAAAAATAAAVAPRGDEEVDSESSRSSIDRSEKKRVKRIVNINEGFGDRGGSAGGEEEGDGVKELACAILKLGEIYERVESTKQRQMIEMEKQRLEFNKGLEFRKMQMLVDSQIQLRKIKHAKRKADASGDGGYVNLVIWIIAIVLNYMIWVRLDHGILNFFETPYPAGP